MSKHEEKQVSKQEEKQVTKQVAKQVSKQDEKRFALPPLNGMEREKEAI